MSLTLIPYGEHFLGFHVPNFNTTMVNISLGFYINYYDTAGFFCVAFVSEPIYIHKY